MIAYKEKNFPMRVVKYWKKLLRELVEPPSLEVFKTRLDVDVGNLL